MTWDEMIEVMRSVKAVEEACELYDKSAAADLLASQIRRLIEDKAELIGRYGELEELLEKEGEQ